MTLSDIWISGFNDKKELIFLLDDNDPDHIPEVTVVNIEAITGCMVGNVGVARYIIYIYTVSWVTGRACGL